MFAATGQERMELRHLRYLVAIADAGTFGRAAEKLSVAQPALTRQIHDLEKELGVELFDSRARKATLTAAGESCVRLARHILADTEHAVAQARLSNSGMVGRCVLSVGPLPLQSGFVPRFVAGMKRRYTGITIVVTERIREDQWDAVVRAEADIGLGIAPPATYAQLHSEIQALFHMDHAVLPPDHPLATRSPISLDDLRDTPFLTLELLPTDFELTRNALVAEMGRRGFPQSSVSPRQFSSLESLVTHVRAGQGWTIGPGAIAQRLPGVVGIPLTDFRAPLRMMRIWRRAERRPVVHTVLRELRRLQEQDESDALMSATGEHLLPVEEFVPTRLELRHLRSFVAVAAQGSIGRAAEMLDVTQPALSRQMRELEYDVGISLLDRGTRGVQLTSAGEEFQSNVRSVLSIVDNLPREVVRSLRASAQRCVIGNVPHPLMDRLLVAAVADLENRTPRVRVGFRTVPTPSQADALRAGEIDIALGHVFPVPVRRLAESVASRRLFDDRICTALVAERHPLAGRESLALRDLADVPFLYVSRSFFPHFHDAVFAAFAAGGLHPTVDEYDGLVTLWSLAAQGAGWTLGWRSHLSEPPPGLRAIPLRDFDLEFGGEVVYRKDESRAPILSAIDAIITLANQMFGGVRAPADRPPYPAGTDLITNS
jgi:LysR family transcriptional regulator, benzoate and cis,cis-muconate-responsive activator of ben and cat genes